MTITLSRSPTYHAIVKGITIALAPWRTNDLAPFIWNTKGSQQNLSSTQLIL
jgi:hypothetical protein